MKPNFVFVDPPSPPGFVSFKHSHGGYGEFCRESRLRIPTLDLFHGAALLQDHGFKAHIVDAVLDAHSIELCAAEVSRLKPSWVVIRTASASLPHDLRVAEAVRASCRARIAFYGPSLSAEPQTALACPAVDTVILGDVPTAFLEFARRGGAAGIWRGGVEDLDALPIPRWDMVDYRRYSYVTSQFSWGCPLGCGYCSYPVTQGALWRARSTESMVREFLALRERYGLRFVLLRDPEFTMNRRRAIELCEALIQAGTPIAWGCDTRLDTLDEELLRLMSLAGCMRVTFGVESLSPVALRLMGRPDMGREFILEKVAALKRHGMLTYALYVIGLPGETRASTRETIDFALELGTEAASFSMATPFQGTALERLAKANGWITARDPRRLTSSVPSMRNEDMSAADIENLTLEAKKRWKGRSKRRGSALPKFELSSRR